MKGKWRRVPASGQSQRCEYSAADNAADTIEKAPAGPISRVIPPDGVLVRFLRLLH
jgi:hypothetical protein